jgi:hypothetical protein
LSQGSGPSGYPAKPLVSFRINRHLSGRTRRYHIADGGMPTVVHVYMLDTDKLLPPCTQASENFHLHCIRLHQTSRSRSESRYPSFRSKTAIHLYKYWHCCCVGAGHLNGERTF